MPDTARTVGRYQVLEEIGRGGMARVHLARQADLDRFVALKELSGLQASNPAFAQRFLRESRVASSLSHPNVVTVFDYLEWEATPYIAMEYLERGSLRRFIGLMTLAQAAAVLEGTLAGLAHAERRAIVHRDMKPENVLVTLEGHVKIADFGIAKATSEVQTESFKTDTGTTLGTPGYMAPEQAMAKPLGPWTDLYSVGCMAYEMLVGHIPFHDSETPMAMLLRHINEPVPSACEVNPDADRDISDWIDWLLSKDTGARPQSAREAWDGFEEIVIARLGPRWRRDSELPEVPPTRGEHAAPSAGTPMVMPGPYTPPPEKPVAPASAFLTFGAHTVEPAGAPPELPDPGGTEDRPDDQTSVPPPPDDEPAPTGRAASSPELPSAPAEPEAPVESEDSPGYRTYLPPPPARPPVDEPAPGRPEVDAPSSAAAHAAPQNSEPPSSLASPTPAEHAPPPASVSAVEQAPTIQPAAAPPEPPQGSAAPRAPGVWAIAGILAAAGVALALVLTSGSDRPKERPSSPPPPAARVGLTAGRLGAKAPPGFESLDQPLSIPDLRLRSAASAAPEGRPAAGAVILGLAGVDSNTPSLLPDRFVAALGLAPGEQPSRQAVAAGPSGWRAYRYAAVRPQGLERDVRLYTWPTSAGVAVIACLAPIPAAQCDATAASLTARDAFAFSLGPDGQYARAVDGAFERLGRTLQSSRREWRNAQSQGAQAAAAGAITSALERAADALGTLRLSPADRRANSAVVGSLRAAALTHRRLARAATRGDGPGYRRAARASTRAEHGIERAFGQLLAQGYRPLIEARFHAWTPPALRPAEAKPAPSPSPQPPSPTVKPEPTEKPTVIPPILPAAPQEEKVDPISPVGPG